MTDKQLDRYEYLQKAVDVLEEKDIGGFWEWLKRDPGENEMVRFHQYKMEEKWDISSDEEFKDLVKTFFDHVKRNLIEYRKEKGYV